MPSFSNVPVVLAHSGKPLFVELAGPTTIVPCALTIPGGFGAPEKLPQRELFGNTPVHCAAATVGSRARSRARTNRFMAI